MSKTPWRCKITCNALVPAVLDSPEDNINIVVGLIHHGSRRCMFVAEDSKYPISLNAESIPKNTVFSSSSPKIRDPLHPNGHTFPSFSFLSHIPLGLKCYIATVLPLVGRCDGAG